MKCPKCDSDNTDTARFCSNCATSLTGAEEVKPSFTKTLETPFPTVNQGTVFADRYEILEKIGEGGMGEVYRALDTNLDRQVAIKILPAAVAQDEERLARFEREAKLLAVLNHSNIAAIYGLEESEGRRFLVLELVEGETLKAKLDSGPLELEEALTVCRQIAEGLETAHDKGIVHRDLKPGNIMVTPEGTAKILDFGLAKAYTGETTNIDIEKSPTITAQMTKPGVVMGTAAYMSPEQARGRAVDKRADIWAFGCVLFECLTGMRAFEGETVSDNLALILKGEPDWEKLPSNTPSNIRVLLRRCLQKDPRSRLRDIGDARIEMRESDSSRIEDRPVIRHTSWKWLFPACISCVLIGLLLGFLLKKRGGEVPSTFPVQSIIKTEPGFVLAPKNLQLISLRRPYRPAVVISKDGTFIIYCAVNNDSENAESQLFLRRLEDPGASAIPGTEGGQWPFLSPDNRWVGFWKDGKLWKVLVEGGIPQELCEATFLFGASWGDNGQIVFAPGAAGGLWAVSPNGGEPFLLMEPDKEKAESSYRLPHHLPRGKGVLFTVMRTFLDMNPDVALLDIRSGEWKELLDNATDARYLSTGHILFLRQGTLMAVPFDLDKPDKVEQPISLLPNVLHMMNMGSTGANTAAGQFSISESGCLVYASGGILPNSQSQLVWVDFNGNIEPVCSESYPFFSPRLSPDGKFVVYSTLGTDRSVRTYDIDRKIHWTVHSGGQRASFFPSGGEIVFNDIEKGDIFRKSLSGDGQVSLLINSPFPSYAASFSPDGNLLAYVESKNGQYDILIYDFRDQSSTPFAVTEDSEYYPMFSPDGRWIAYYYSNVEEDGVIVRSSSGAGSAVQVSRGSGHSPLWSRDGKKLYYLAGEFEEVWVADVLDQNKPGFGSPRLLFKSSAYRLFASVPFRGYDISLDDQRLLTYTPEIRTPQPVTEIHLILNWSKELKRLVPTDKK